MMLLRLMDMEDGADNAARGPRGLLDFEWFDRFAPGSVPVARGGLMGNLVPLPQEPADPLWGALDRSLPWPMRGRTYPTARWPFQPQPMPSAGGANLPPVLDREGWRLAIGRNHPFWPEAPSKAVAIPVAGVGGEISDDHLASTAERAEPDIVRTTASPQPSRVAQAGPPRDWQMPMTPGQDTVAADVEREFREAAGLGRSLGLIEAPADIDHYLGASGEPRIIHRDRARQFGPIRDGADLNESRLVAAITDRHAGMLNGLQDGQTVVFKDDFAKAYGDADFIKHLLYPDTRDFALAFGNTQVKSEGDFAATRVGDEIHIEGTVGHYWEDDFDFHPERYAGIGGIKARDAAILEQHGRAKPFARKASWPRRVSGRIRIENGQLKDPAFSWEDIDQ